VPRLAHVPLIDWSTEATEVVCLGGFGVLRTQGKFHKVTFVFLVSFVVALAHSETR